MALEHLNSEIISVYFFPNSSGFQSASFNCDKSGMQHSHCSPEHLQCKVGIHSFELHHVGIMNVMMLLESLVIFMAQTKIENSW